MATSFYTRVRKVLPIARQIILNGIDCGQTDICEYIDRLTEPNVEGEAEITRLIDWSDEHYVIGVAVGLLLGPGVLDAQTTKTGRKA